jgi:hypothetical protein
MIDKTIIIKISMLPTVGNKEILITNTPAIMLATINIMIRNQVTLKKLRAGSFYLSIKEKYSPIIILSLTNNLKIGTNNIIKNNNI